MKFPGKHLGLLMPENYGLPNVPLRVSNPTTTRGLSKAGECRSETRLKRGKRNATLEVA